MKLIHALLILGSLSVITSTQFAITQEASMPKPPFKLEISGRRDSNDPSGWDFANNAGITLRAGSMFEFCIRKTNVSDHEIDKWSAGGPTLDLLDSSGHPVKRREPNPSRAITGGGPDMLVGTKDNKLQPGETRMQWSPLSSDLDISQPGTYTVQESEHVTNDPASPVIKSNIITFTVLPPDAPSQQP